MPSTDPTYQPLKENEIRARKLPKAANQTWRLVHLKIGQMTKINGLSHTWGPPEARRKMIIDGHAISIRQNLANARAELTPRLITGTGIAKAHYFWIDTVCTNQADDVERGH